MSTDSTRFMRALRRLPVDQTPVWFMRQAGRVLPEYRAIRQDRTLLEICRWPDLCAEVTLQPLRRFNLDAAILFADIMHPLIGAGVDLDIVDGAGPIIHSPVRSHQDLAALQPLVPEESLSFVFDTIRILKSDLGDRVPLIGFSGAPFTLASYLIEGKASRDFVHTKAMMYSAPDLWHALMQRLTEMVIAYLHAQREAGVDALQLFDSWVGCLAPRDYQRFVRPYLRRIFAALAPSGAPVIHFGVNTATLLHLMKDEGADAIGVDWRIPLDDAWAIIGDDLAIQGNLDPAVLFGTPEFIAREVGDVLARAGGRPGHVFNLGHGLLPTTPLDGVERTVDCVRAHSLAGRGVLEFVAART
ncbi:MAG TPA: uroporphyrinogen decarboxylase [Gemmatimonadaceae bacterium]|nr:uroporphyrinogen decarboxylase [Gemmatimonadaceae bacterium]